MLMMIPASVALALKEEELGLAAFPLVPSLTPAPDMGLETRQQVRGGRLRVACGKSQPRTQTPLGNSKNEPGCA